MTSQLATIRIKNLRLRTYIGIKDEEVRNRQDIVINATLRYDARPAAVSDDIAHVLNYRSLTKQMIAHAESNRFALLERLTHELLGILMEPDAVREASIEVDKPHALRYADSVSMQMCATRPATP